MQIANWKPSLYPRSGIFAALLGLLLGSVPVAAQLYPDQIFYPESGVGVMAQGDFNGDSLPDFVSIRAGVATLFFGKGDGTFKIGPAFDAGSGANAVVVADVNQDGKLDLIVSHHGTYLNDLATVSVLLGDGTGNFGAKQDYTTGLNAVALAVGDIDGDGKLDIITANEGTLQPYVMPGTMSVLLNHGNGTFGPNHDFPIKANPSCLAVADLNGDGKADILCGFNASEKLSVFLNQGSGVFASPAEYGPDGYIYYITVADFNGDGTPDVALGYYRTITFTEAESGVITLTGKGDGSFTTSGIFPVDGNIYGLIALDFNGDGKTDLLATHDGSASQSLFPGNGDGTFGPQKNYLVGSVVAPPFVTDVNADGKLDFVLPNPYYDALEVVPGLGDGNLSVPEYLSGLTYNFALSDVNHDGRPDVVFFNANTGKINVLLSNRDGTFQPPIVSDYADQDFYSLADVNGDGFVDLVSTLADDILVYAGDGQGHFTLQHSFNNPDYGEISTIADVDGDGKPDLMIANPYDNNIAFWKGDGKGGFTRNQTIPTTGRVSILLLQDIDGDGKLDLIFATEYSNLLSLRHGNGDGTFQAETMLPQPNTISTITIADVNKDGRLDILVGCQNESSDTSGILKVLLNQGNGTFQDTSVSTPFLNVAHIAVADVNGDGNLDLVINDHAYSNKLCIFAGKGAGTFTLQGIYYPGGNSSLYVTDVNGDGLPDILSLAGSSSPFVLLHLPVNPVLHRFSGTLHLEGLVAAAPAQNVTFTFRNGADSFTRSVSINATGVFSIAGIPAGNYTVHIKGANTLAVNLPLDVTNGDFSSVNLTLRTGDADGDNLVTIGDFGLLVNAYGSAINDGSGLYDPRCDFNGDGTVDLGDFGLFVNNYGSTGDL